MDLHHLKIFVAIYNKRSFSLASKELNISQPTISEHIKNLESELGTQLFDRLPRTILPTKAAEAIYPKAVHLLEEADSIRDMVASSSGTISGLLKLGSSTIPGTYMVPKLAGDFKKSHPEVNFEVIINDSEHISNMVLEHELILGITGAVMDRTMLNYTPFATDRLVLAAPPSMDIAQKISPENLRDLPLVIRESGSGTRKTTEDELMRYDIKHEDLSVAGVLGSTSSVKEAVLSGLGASFFSRLSIEKEIQRGDLKEISIKGIEMKREFYVIHHKRRQLSPPYLQFMDQLLSLKG